MEKVVKIGDSEVRMRASALIPRLYRFEFGRDMVQDMQKLQTSYKKILDAKKNGTEENFDVIDLTIFENIAWLMARHADKDAIPDTPDEWLDSLDGVFTIYEILPQIFELWRLNTAQTSKPKKK